MAIFLKFSIFYNNDIIGCYLTIILVFLFLLRKLPKLRGDLTFGHYMVRLHMFYVLYSFNNWNSHFLILTRAFLYIMWFYFYLFLYFIFQVSNNLKCDAQHNIWFSNSFQYDFVLCIRPKSQWIFTIKRS